MRAVSGEVLTDDSMFPGLTRERIHGVSRNVCPRARKRERALTERSIHQRREKLDDESTAASPGARGPHARPPPIVGHAVPTRIGRARRILNPIVLVLVSPTPQSESSSATSSFACSLFPPPAFSTTPALPRASSRSHASVNSRAHVACSLSPIAPDEHHDPRRRASSLDVYERPLLHAPPQLLRHIPRRVSRHDVSIHPAHASSSPLSSSLAPPLARDRPRRVVAAYVSSDAEARPARPATPPPIDLRAHVAASSSNNTNAFSKYVPPASAPNHRSLARVIVVDDFIASESESINESMNQ